MFEGLNYIELSGKSYPIKCDLVVLERIQDEFGSINDFEDRVMPWEPALDKEGKEKKGNNGKKLFKARVPDIKAVNAALEFMVNEGEEITAEKEDRAPKFLSRKELARRVDITPVTLADKLHQEFQKCFQIKNEETTQSQTETGEITE